MTQKQITEVNMIQLLIFQNGIKTKKAFNEAFFLLDV